MITCLGVLLGINLSTMDAGSGDLADSDSEEVDTASKPPPSTSTGSASKPSKSEPTQSGDTKNKPESATTNAQVIRNLIRRKKGD